MSRIMYESHPNYIYPKGKPYPNQKGPSTVGNPFLPLFFVLFLFPWDLLSQLQLLIYYLYSSSLGKNKNKNSGSVQICSL
jgi:hypothetical protein